MQREADLIEQQIKMRGSAPGQSGGKWFVAALSELVPRFFSFAPSSSLKIYYILKYIFNDYVAALLLSQHSSNALISFNFEKTTATIFFSLFFSFLYFLYKTTYLPYINNYKKNTRSFLYLQIKSSFGNICLIVCCELLCAPCKILYKK